MPKVKTIQIVWHEKEPVYSVDFHPDGTLATAGADKEIKLWQVMETLPSEQATIEQCCSFLQSSANCDSN